MNEVKVMSNEPQRPEIAQDIGTFKAQQPWIIYANGLEQRIAELEAENKRLRDGWPKECPITHRPFFMAIHHPDLGEIPTYGGPFDSYSIPVPDEDGDFIAQHFDHDEGTWDEAVYSEGVWLVTEAQRNKWIEVEDRLEQADQLLGDVVSDVRMGLSVGTIEAIKRHLQEKK